MGGLSGLSQDRKDALKLIEFMGLMAGLLGVVATLGTPYVRFPPYAGEAFVGYLVLFVTFSMVGYARTLAGEAFPIQTLISIFTLLVSILFGVVVLSTLGVASSLASQYAWAVFLLAALVFNIMFIILIPPRFKGPVKSGAS